MAKPEITFKVGGVRASVFRNVIQQGGREVALPKVVLEVRYRDKTGQWKSTSSLSINDLPKAVTALQKAYEYLLSEQSRPGETTQRTGDQGSSEDFTTAADNR